MLFSTLFYIQGRIKAYGFSVRFLFYLFKRSVKRADNRRYAKLPLYAIEKTGEDNANVRFATSPVGF